MVQMRETGTNSPNISCDFQLVLRGRLVAAPTDASLHKQQFLCVYGGAKNRPTDVRQFYGATKVCKPGSVLTAIYLAPQLLTGSSRLLGTVGQTSVPPRRCSGIEFTAPQCSHEASALLPHFFTMTGKPATYLCCTCPEVTLGGRYPLSLPCGARTFLIWCLSASIRGCPTWLRKYCTA